MNSKPERSSVTEFSTLDIFVFLSMGSKIMIGSCSCAFNSSKKVSDTNLCDLLVSRTLRGQTDHTQKSCAMAARTLGFLTQPQGLHLNTTDA